MKIGNLNIGKVVLAPLAGYTNKVYRMIAKEMGADLVFSEMISAKGLLYDNERTWVYTDIDPNEHPIALQLFGSEEEEMYKAAMLLSNKTKTDIIDINMGCPVHKVLKQNSGANLLKDLQKVYTITRAVVSGSSVPVTVKIRAGLSHEQINCQEVAKMIEKAGASAITIHGRTKTDLYRGHVNLDYIKMVKQAVNIPVIANGDIKSAQDALEMLKYTKADAVMIGRGTLGNPWLIKEVAQTLKGEEFIPPTKKERLKMMLYHLNELIKLKGEKVAILEMRSLASWYVKGFYQSKIFKQQLMNIVNYEDFKKIVIDNFLDELNS